MPASPLRFVPLALLLAAAAPARAEQPAPPVQPPGAAKPAAGEAWTPLFDGKSLAGWKESDFAGGGPVRIENGTLVLGSGVDLTGVTATRPVPETDYEVRLEAKRVDGSDFFCGLTFPVGDDHLTLIVGGWGGGVIGLSSLNGSDASENETTTYERFESDRWYPIRLRVTSQSVTAWIDGEQVIDQDLRNRTLSTRVEVEASKPFGLATWQTTAALKDIRLRKLTPAEVKAVHAELPDVD